MENQANEMEKDEVINPEQFQVGRAPETEKNGERDDTEYTEGEAEFADGEGTQLAEEFESNDTDGVESGSETELPEDEQDELDEDELADDEFEDEHS
jgi:hypothetical protein